MGKMIGHGLTRSDFQCRCGCGLDTVDSELAYVIRHLEETLGEKAVVTSGHRCLVHNRNVGSTDSSRHVQGRAADIYFPSYKPYTIYKLLDERYPDTFGIGLYHTFVHIDTRKKRARW